ncbi:o-succinylbenzoate synthase [Erwinia endophytica]|uniref:o-succinylbenzoate synthase n=1 Tax=Erwinia endophytica TaxID=1563158 RepID=UPI001265E8EF|nr:o-succinylbenzoate synthase [Erwinia endophytica]KAB8312239.1 o-succinylbenzoate synthase [Erwinia endophytica]
MRGATLWAYCLPLEAGTVLRDRRVKERCGLLVRLTADEGEGWGEIAPLPGFSAETLAEARNDAIRWLASWCSGEAPGESQHPSVAYGLSCAMAELAGELPDAGNYNSAMLCTGDPDKLFNSLQQQPLAKMKVGIVEPVRDGMMVSLLLEALPELTLRLDANRQWSLDKARQFARFVSSELRSRIAFIEEPCHTPQASREFARESGIALAWDETVREVDYPLVAEPYLRAIVIKPMLTGSLSKVRALVAQAEQAGIAAIISSSLESSLGLAQLARLAAWLTPTSQPGLDTLNVMRQQLVRSWPDCPLPLILEGELEVVWQR